MFFHMGEQLIVEEISQSVATDLLFYVDCTAKGKLILSGALSSS
jgi:hypothetical protein